MLLLPDSYGTWIATQALVDAGQGLPADIAERERQAHAQDLEAYRRESSYIRAGIQLLLESRTIAQTLASRAALGSWAALDARAAPWEAWLLTNEAFALYGGERFTDWRLFQLAFILAHVPTFASRMPEFAHRFDADRDELTASLLYFATGGGKSEAFFGLLVFNVFLDRLRRKHRGVTALVRYPLRLLTLQQARRLMRILTNAELVKIRRRVPGAPFEIGFWVGSGNTPNRAAQGFGGVPAVTLAGYANDTGLLNPPEGDTDAARASRRRSDRYRETLESYDKLRVCPCCGSPTGMRRYPSQAGRIGIVCFNDACDWNRENPPSPHRVPLPFLLTDDTIYQRAPAVVLGTIDKLALIGQHDRTINHIVGMLGVARFMDPDNRHFHMPRGPRSLTRAQDDGWTRLKPAYADGAVMFHDPFPSLIIQDEGHLLEESLGTFSGLFETAFESILTRLGNGILKDVVATWRPDPQSDARRPRLAKVIAATATISDPDRQLRVLYQREPMRFPCPGPGIYESFYAMPRAPLNAKRRRLAAEVPVHLRTEQFTPRMRSYVSIMTNGRSHTMTTSAVVSAYHVTITRLWRAVVEEGRAQDAVNEMTAALNPDDPLTALRRDGLQALVTQGNTDGPGVLATLLDLQRISVTYVTNKKGGDQIIETLQTQVERDQRGEGIGDLPFVTELISGGVTIAEIQDVMRQAETSVAPGQGGKGACLSVPIDGAAIDFSARQTRRDQIMESLQEFCQNWPTRGMAINRDAAIYEQQLLDGCFHNPMRQGHASVDIALDRFEFLRPERMGYLPGPLVYRCDTCELVREYVSPAHQVAEPLPTTCTSEGGRPAHGLRWRQLDVVYAHWSGGIEGLSPYRYTMDRGGTVQKIPRCQCGAENFRLVKQGNRFSRWRFICIGCSAQREIYQTDPFSLNLLKPLIDAGVPHQWSEINMIPVSYRASPVFYVQTARFIVFDTDPEVITLMGPSREDDLAARVALLHGFAGNDPSDERIREQLERNAQGAIFAPYEMFRAREAAARVAGDAASVETWADAARTTLSGWYEAGLVSREVSASPALQAQMHARGGYAARASAAFLDALRPKPHPVCSRCRTTMATTVCYGS